MFIYSVLVKLHFGSRLPCSLSGAQWEAINDFHELSITVKVCMKICCRFFAICHYQSPDVQLKMKKLPVLSRHKACALSVYTAHFCKTMHT